MNGADTAWMIVATALVLFMSLPGLALFYGGLVRARNVLSVFMHVYAIAALMSVLWLVVGYSIAFGSGGSGLWGGLDKMLLLGIDAETLSGTLPEVLFFAFQMTFAIITKPGLCGGVVRLRRGPSTMAITSAASPAVSCTTMPPAKSRTPVSPKSPPSAKKPPPQIQCTTGA